MAEVVSSQVLISAEEAFVVTVTVAAFAAVDVAGDAERVEVDAVVASELGDELAVAVAAFVGAAFELDDGTVVVVAAVFVDVVAAAAVAVV